MGLTYLAFLHLDLSKIYIIFCLKWHISLLRNILLNIKNLQPHLHFLVTTFLNFSCHPTPKMLPSYLKHFPALFQIFPHTTPKHFWPFHSLKKCCHSTPKIFATKAPIFLELHHPKIFYHFSPKTFAILPQNMFKPHPQNFATSSPKKFCQPPKLFLISHHQYFCQPTPKKNWPPHS